MRRLPPTRYIPQGSTPHTIEGADAVVYLYNHQSKRPAGIAYAGKANRPAWHYTFANLAQAEHRTTEWLTEMRTTQAIRAQRQAERAAARAQGHPYQVGDILHHSWGWEQTNCDYYQVIAVTKGTVTLRKIAAKDAERDTGNSMACYLLPAADRFLADQEPFVKRPQTSDGKSWHIPMEHGWCNKWDGKPNYCSWYA